ncbi:MAG: hypothetical protein JJ921_10780 [Pseudomonadales bacterium]|nr:hypothetical protein [Pseudomonadales bacterium]MBO7005238.1 hypothetical protein [Pseudomonadales bacterium]
MKNSKLSLQEVWQLGCQGEKLTVDDQKRFATMARSRFHTFQMGMTHAQEQINTDQTQSLVAGLAVELKDNPGLKVMWERMSISESDFGQQVTVQLERIEQPVIH